MYGKIGAVSARFLIIALMLGAPFVAAEEGPQTALDKALQAAWDDPEHQLEYYNVFLNSQILIPTVDRPETTGVRLAGDDETISPVIIESEGVQYLMLFDTEERLADWARRPMGFAGVPGHAIVRTMKPDFYWLLNVGTDYTKRFVPEEISWLKSEIVALDE
ncbi:MAG: SseB family protein [Candidatus Omnitrophota bacterium]|nr:SseB family protein [Candidatus Omnitrophota bacterium]